MRLGDGVNLLDDNLLEERLHFAVGLLVLGPGHQAAVVEAMQQIVDGLKAHRRAEFLREDVLDIAPPERTDAILGSRWGVEALLQARVLLRIQPGWASAPGSLVERGDVPSVVLGDPVLDGTQGAAQRLGDVLCGAALPPP